MGEPNLSALGEWLRVGLPSVALAISIASLWFTRKLWVQSNRPIVSAFIQTNFGGNQAILYDIVVVNSGLRPAINVQLRAQTSHVQAALADGVASSVHHKPILEAAQRCFSFDADIPVLLNNERRSNSFGFTGNAGVGGTLWKVGASIPITVAYDDLEGRHFESKLTLRIKDTVGFAGGSWAS